MPLIETKLPDDAKIAIFTHAEEREGEDVPVLLAVSIPLDEPSQHKDQDPKNASAFSHSRFVSMMELFGQSPDIGTYVNVAAPSKPVQKIAIAPYALIGSSIQRFALASRQLIDHPSSPENLLELSVQDYLTQKDQKIGQVLLKYQEAFLTFAKQSLADAKKYTTIWLQENKQLLLAKKFTLIDYDELTDNPLYQPIYDRLLTLFTDEDNETVRSKKLLQIAVTKDAGAFVSRETSRFADKTLGLKKLSDEVKAKIRILSVLHFLEETAAMLVLWASKGINITLYPGKVFETLNCVLEDSKYKALILEVIRTHNPMFDQPTFRWHHLRVNINSTAEDKQIVEKKPVDTIQENKIPISVIHDVTGHIQAYDGLIKGLHQYHIIPICNPGNLQQFQQFNKLAEAAQMHAEHILKTQKHGPYYIVGYSHGATVGAAIAEYLKKQRHDVHLIIIDAFSPGVILQLSNEQYADYLLMIAQSFVAQLDRTGYKVELNTESWGKLKVLTKQEQIEKLSEVIILLQQEKIANFKKELDIVKGNLFLGLSYHEDDNQSKLEHMLVFYTQQLSSLAQKFNVDMSQVYGWARYTEDSLDLTYVNGNSNHATIMSSPHVSKIVGRILSFLSASPGHSPQTSAVSSPSYSPKESPQMSPKGKPKKLKPDDKVAALGVSSDSINDEELDPQAMSRFFLKAARMAELLSKKSSVFSEAVSSQEGASLQERKQKKQQQQSDLSQMARLEH